MTANPPDSGFADGPSLDLPSPESVSTSLSYSSFVPVLCGAKIAIITINYAMNKKAAVRTSPLREAIGATLNSA
jgi:hypothetical protein